MKLAAARIDASHFQVDMRGWVCPYPKYAVEGLVGKLRAGSRLDLLVDCPSAATDVPRVVESMGCSVPEVARLGDGEWRITIEKG